MAIDSPLWKRLTPGPWPGVLGVVTVGGILPAMGWLGDHGRFGSGSGWLCTWCSDHPAFGFPTANNGNEQYSVGIQVIGNVCLLVALFVFLGLNHRRDARSLLQDLRLAPAAPHLWRSALVPLHWLWPAIAIPHIAIVAVLWFDWRHGEGFSLIAYPSAALGASCVILLADRFWLASAISGPGALVAQATACLYLAAAFLDVVTRNEMLWFFIYRLLPFPAAVCFAIWGLRAQHRLDSSSDR